MNKLKRLLCLVLCFALLCAAPGAALADGAEAAEPAQQTDAAPADAVQIAATSAILMDLNTGTVLYEKEADTVLPPASITKIMTILLVFEALDSGKISLTDTVTASAHACSMGGSQIWLKEGEQFTVDELLKATCIKSANDTSVALAEFVSGSEEAFVAEMNKRAQELGMTNTVFKNASGLDADGHVSTARDIALMSRELMKHKDVTKYTTVWMDYLRDGTTQLVNTNKLINSYDGITGLKTGTTNLAKNCLSATAERDGLGLVAVVMGCETSADRFQSARTLLDYGFAGYEIVTPQVDTSGLVKAHVAKGVNQYLPLELGEVTGVLVPKGRGGELTQVTELEGELEAPVAKGQKVGVVKLYLDDKLVSEIDVLTGMESPRINFLLALQLLLGHIVGI